MLDVGGQDATEAFEDVGHSDEAREILNGMLVGNLKREVCMQSSSILQVDRTEEQYADRLCTSHTGRRPSQAQRKDRTRHMAGQAVRSHPDPRRPIPRHLPRCSLCCTRSFCGILLPIQVVQ